MSDHLSVSLLGSERHLAFFLSSKREVDIGTLPKCHSCRVPQEGSGPVEAGSLTQRENLFKSKV